MSLSLKWLITSAKFFIAWQHTISFEAKGFSEILKRLLLTYAKYRWVEKCSFYDKYLATYRKQSHDLSNCDTADDDLEQT